MNRGPDKDGFDTEPIGALAFYPWHNEPKPEPEPESPEVLSAKLRAFLNAKARPDGD